MRSSNSLVLEFHGWPLSGVERFDIEAYSRSSWNEGEELDTGVTGCVAGTFPRS